MKLPWAKLTVALLMIFIGPIVSCQAEAQNVAVGPGTASAQTYERIDANGTFHTQSEKA
jgi:hypothetical protein